MQSQKGPNLINNLSKEIICKNHFKLHWRLPELDVYVSDESINKSSVWFYKFWRIIPLKLFSVNFTSLETSKKICQILALCHFHIKKIIKKKKRFEEKFTKEKFYLKNVLKKGTTMQCPWQNATFITGSIRIRDNFYPNS